MNSRAVDRMVALVMGKSGALVDGGQRRAGSLPCAVCRGHEPESPAGPDATRRTNMISLENAHVMATPNEPPSETRILEIETPRSLDRIIGTRSCRIPRPRAARSSPRERLWITGPTGSCGPMRAWPGSVSLSGEIESRVASMNPRARVTGQPIIRHTGGYARRHRHGNRRDRPSCGTAGLPPDGATLPCTRLPPPETRALAHRSGAGGGTVSFEVDNPALDRHDKRLRPVGDTELAEYVGHVNLDRPLHHAESCGDLLVALPLGDVLQHLEFAR